MSAPPCTQHVTPADSERLRKLIKSELPDGAIVCLAPGTYHVSLWIEKSITLRGSGRDEVIIEGDGRRPTINVNDENAVVTIESLTLRNGNGDAPAGGNLDVTICKNVTVRDVTLRDGVAEAGGAAQVERGTVSFERCLMTGNRGELAQALFTLQSAKVSLHDCTLAGNVGGGPVLTAGWISHVTIANSTIVGDATAAVRVVSNGAQAPTVEVSHSILAGAKPVEVLRGGEPVPKVLLEHNALSAAPAGEGVTARDNVIGPIELDASHRPKAGSKAAGFGAK